MLELNMSFRNAKGHVAGTYRTQGALPCYLRIWKSNIGKPLTVCQYLTSKS
jgi:hypothetical protein